MVFKKKFSGELSFLSNFYEASFKVNDTIYRSVEHFYQSLKSNDPKEQEEIRNALTPGKAKKLGKNIKSKRANFEKEKIEIMYIGVKEKFLQNEFIAKKLVLVDDKDLVEENSWGDTFWGIDINTKIGQDNLGKILRKVKKLLIKKGF